MNNLWVHTKTPHSTLASAELVWQMDVWEEETAIRLAISFHLEFSRYVFDTIPRDSVEGAKFRSLWQKIRTSDSVSDLGLEAAESLQKPTYMKGLDNHQKMSHSEYLSNIDNTVWVLNRWDEMKWDEMIMPALDLQFAHITIIILLESSSLKTSKLPPKIL